MRIAVILDNRLQDGGGFQQELSTISLLNKNQASWQTIFYTTRKENIGILERAGVAVKYLNAYSVGNKLYCHLASSELLYKILRFVGIRCAPFEGVLAGDGVDLVYFLSPSWLALFISQTNFIVTIWDICHRDCPEFPEVNFGREFAAREIFLRKAALRAVAVVVSAESSKIDLLERYGCYPDRVHVARMLPSVGVSHGSSVDVKKKYALGDRYIFYPAQFWPHKNHVYIIDALKIMKERFGTVIDAVFSGSDKGNLKSILDHARRLGLEQNVHYVGFVPSEEIASFYKQSMALVMPTYFGPTNIPPLEAFALECPVCYSDLPAMREQVKDAAFLMDLDDPASLAGHIMTLLNDPQAVRRKIERGRQVISEWTEADYYRVLEGIFEKYSRKLRCRKND